MAEGGPSNGGNTTYTVKELIADLRHDLRGDIQAVDKKIDSLDNKIDVQTATHSKEHSEHEREHAKDEVEAALARSAPDATPAGKQLLELIRGVIEVQQVHERRWQRIIGVLLVLTFLGVSTLLSILGLFVFVFVRLISTS